MIQFLNYETLFRRQNIVFSPLDPKRTENDILPTFGCFVIHSTMEKLTKRQLKILGFIREKGSAGNQEIKTFLQEISRITVIRDLNALLKKGIIRKEGKGRNTSYLEAVFNEFLRYLDIETLPIF